MVNCVKERKEEERRKKVYEYCDSMGVTGRHKERQRDREAGIWR